MWLDRWPVVRFAIVCLAHTCVFLLSRKMMCKIKSPCSPWGNKDRINHSAVPPCLPEDPATSRRCQHTVCPLTLAMRQKILGVRRSLCPPRPICCPAFRSALSHTELSVDAPCSFTPASMVSTYVMPVIHHLCGFVKHYFSHTAHRCARQKYDLPPCGRFLKFRCYRIKNSAG